MVKLLPDEEFLLQIPMEEIHSLRDAPLPSADLTQRPLVERQVISLQMSDSATRSPVVLTRTEEVLPTVDGYHQREAAKRRRFTELQATIRLYASE